MAEQAWSNFVNSLDDLDDDAKKELKKFVSESSKSGQAFVKRQGEKVQLYLNHLAAGEITKKQLQGYLEDIQSLTAGQVALMSGKGKKAAQTFLNKLGVLLLQGLIAAI